MRKNLSNLPLRVAALALLGLCAAGPAAAQVTPYYIAAGDQLLMTVVQGGGVVNAFPIPNLGYPLAIQSTVWVGDRDDRGATEYTLAGVPTGNTSLGGVNFTQILDGTTNGINNFGVECCGVPNSVTIANLDWSNQAVLFNLPGGEDGIGITYDPITNHLFVGAYSGTLFEYDLAGNIVNTSSPALPFAGLSSLAYEAATDTLWSARVDTVWQLDKSGNVLQSFGGFNFGNNFGGEMPLGTDFVPEPSSLVLLSGAFAFGVVNLRRRRW